MKKIILALIAILIVIFAVLSVLSPDKEYAAEKLFYCAMKTNSKIAANPDVAPPALLASVESDLKRLIVKYPESNVAKPANWALAEFYLIHKDYGKALSAAEDILEKYKDDAATASAAQFLKGVVYEREGEWPKALVEFKTLQDKYTVTQLGLQAPLYIANYYNAKGEEAKAEDAYARARSFYEKMEREYTGKNIGYAASMLMIQTCLNSGDYERAGQAIESTLGKYPAPVTFRQLLPHVDPVFIEKLGQPERAIAIYRSITEKTKDEGAIKALQEKIDSLESKE